MQMRSKIVISMIPLTALFFLYCILSPVNISAISNVSDTQEIVKLDVCNNALNCQNQAPGFIIENMTDISFFSIKMPLPEKSRFSYTADAIYIIEKPPRV